MTSMASEGQSARNNGRAAVRLARRAALAAMVITLAAAASGCDDDDREPNRVDLALRPGQSAAFTFQVTVDESEEADFLVSCDFVDIIEIDTLNLAAEVEGFGKSGSFDCATHIIVAAWPEADPGEYEIRVRFYYTYFLNGVGEDDTDGYIRVTVVG